jgi:hypothetical protein
MGQLPDIVIGKNHRAKLQIPRWLKKWELEDFNTECKEINSDGKTIAPSCRDVLIFIDQDNMMLIEPNRDWVGRIRITLVSVNIKGDADSTCFDVDIGESDPDDRDNSLA